MINRLKTVSLALAMSTIGLTLVPGMASAEQWQIVDVTGPLANDYATAPKARPGVWSQLVAPTSDANYGSLQAAHLKPHLGGYLNGSIALKPVIDLPVSSEGSWYSDGFQWVDLKPHVTPPTASMDMPNAGETNTIILADLKPHLQRF